MNTDTIYLQKECVPQINSILSVKAHSKLVIGADLIICDPEDADDILNQNIKNKEIDDGAPTNTLPSLSGGVGDSPT